MCRELRLISSNVIANNLTTDFKYKWDGSIGKIMIDMYSLHLVRSWDHSQTHHQDQAQLDLHTQAVPRLDQRRTKWRHRQGSVTSAGTQTHPTLLHRSYSSWCSIYSRLHCQLWSRQHPRDTSQQSTSDQSQFCQEITNNDLNNWKRCCRQ